jgi:uncharacterized circularly permuted ATP-grasp superfamily protein/uncharacterized alpha-E superfamily protein
VNDKPPLLPIHHMDNPWQHAIEHGAAGHYSNLQQGQQLHPHWVEFLSKIPQEDQAEYLCSKHTDLAKQIRDNGITYNVYADQAQGTSRPWSLELLPQIIGPQEWATLSEAVAQRARLLNLMMSDVYGAQTLLHKGLLPADLVFGHPGYLPQMHGAQPKNQVWLHLQAFDLGKSPDGQWWFITHRTMTPSGLGYALENRLSISRSFPRAFRDMHIQHLAKFYREYIDSLRTLSAKGENARIALLTPGPFNETYFEHTYLARYLGITLVEGSDLVMRNNKIFLKTVHGLEQIDGLIRRTDDPWLDPLELRDDSQLGIPGLLQAIRAGHLVMANMPGSAWLESPALHGFMPGLGQHYLQEDLLLPSVPSWWCGERPAWVNASKRLNKLVIKPTSPNRSGKPMEPVMGGELDEIEERAWLSRISRRPSKYTLQELIPLSKAPIWTEQKTVEQRSMMLRLFAVTDGQGQYTVMPGGLSRIAGDQNGIVSMQRGGSSLDTWVISTGPVDQTSNIKERLQAKDLQDLRRPVSSRVAEHLFWLGRYTERASYSVRLLMHSQRLLDDNEYLPANTLGFMQELCSKQGLCSEPDPSTPQDQTEFEEELQHATEGLSKQLNNLAIVAGQLRDRLSSTHWHLLTNIAKVLPSTTTTPPKLFQNNASNTPLEQIQLYLLAMHGEQSDHMTRDHGWRFLQLGRQIERLSGACDSLLSMTSLPGRASENSLALAIALADSTITYRSRYQHRFEWLPTLDLLIFDQDAPYSIKRILYKLNVTLNQLPSDTKPVRALFDQAYQQGTLPSPLSLEGLQPPFPASTGKVLRNWLQNLQDTAYKLSDLVGAQYFRLAELPDQVIQGR